MKATRELSRTKGVQLEMKEEKGNGKGRQFDMVMCVCLVCNV